VIEECKIKRIQPSKADLQYHRHLETSPSQSDDTNKIEISDRDSNPTRSNTDRNYRSSQTR
jgi:hypothetical protein